MIEGLQRIRELLTKALALVRTYRNWPRVLWDHLRVVDGGDYVSQLRQGAQFWVRGGTDDRHVLFEIFALQSYPLELAQGYVVDVGANIGGFTVAAARRGCRVVAFEPHSENFKQLKKNIELNNLQNVECHPVAVSGADGQQEMYLPDNPGHTGRFSLFPGRGEQARDVTCIHLGQWLKRRSSPSIGLIKLDCQGSEYDILYSLDDDIISRIQSIIAECEEFHPPGERSIERLAGYLSNRGFETKIRKNLLSAWRPEREQGTRA